MSTPCKYITTSFELGVDEFRVIEDAYEYYKKFSTDGKFKLYELKDEINLKQITSMKKNHYYLVKIDTQHISRIKVVTVVDEYIGYIHANARNNMDSILTYVNINTNPFEIVKDLGTNPEFSLDEISF